jgi:hypothetical protein
MIPVGSNKGMVRHDVWHFVLQAVLRLILILMLTIIAGLSSVLSGTAAEPADDVQIEAIRGIFQEPRHGVPGVSADQVDKDFAVRIYRQDGALGALERILAGPGYGDVNEKLGQVREKAMLECWAEVVGETGVRIELNNAGKRNGGRSDLDVFLFTDDTEVYDESGTRIPPDGVHAYLISRFNEKWSRRMPGTSPGQWDIMVFPGDSMMIDWRMSKSSWRGFMARMNADIASLSATEGAYFIPGVYKDQVFRRYLTEGRTTIIESVADARNADSRGLDLPDGVRILADLPTREASLRYAGVPGDVDRPGALGVLLQNVVETDRHAGSVIKRAKYSGRWIEGYAQLTNLEQSYRKLLLEGRDGARRHFAEKLFRQFSGRKSLPPNIQSADELMRVLDTMNRIELDKVLADMPPESRPKNWTAQWRQYRVSDIADVRTKLAYFGPEAQEMRASMRAASARGYGLDDAALAGHAEEMFMDKARQAARMAAASAARSAMDELFSRQGAARQIALHGPEAAARQIVERAKGLHAALVFLNDEAMMRAIVAEAPPEARSAIDDLAAIARAQREDILLRRSAVEKLNKGQLSESDEVVTRLLRDLGLDRDELERTPSPDPDGTSIRQRVKMTLAGEIKGHNARRIYQFFSHDLPNLRTVGGFASQYWDNVYDIGTLDTLGKAAASWVTGDTDGAMRELVLGAAEGIPVAGKLFSLGKSVQAYGSGSSGSLMTFLSNQFLSAVPEGAKYGAALGFVLAVYGLEESLYKVGWHFIGKPAQDDLVSLVLMGSMNSIPRAMAQGESAMPMIRSDEDWKILKDSAILRKKVPIPDALQKSRELREALLRAYLQPQATRLAAARSGGADMRETILQTEFFPYWEYWLRRILLFETMFKEVSQTLTPERMRMEAYAPFFITSKNKDEYRAAYRTRVDGTEVWNHAEAWLRYHFREKVLEEWIGAQREHGEVMNYLNNPIKRPFVFGDWETQVVEELVSYYKEGEVFSVARDANEADLKAKLRNAKDEAERQRIAAELGFVEGARDGAEAVLNKVLVEEAEKARARQQLLEKAYWHQTVQKRFETAMEQAVKSQGALPPKEGEPRIVLKIARPVGLLGSAIPMEVAVHGDARLVPDAVSLEVFLEYRKVGETQGRLPKEVLRDDVRALFGRDEDPDRLKVVEHDLTVRVTSKTMPEFKVEPVRARLFWLAYGDVEDEADEDAAAANQAAVDAAMEALRGMEAEAGRMAAEAGNRCREGLALVDDLERLLGVDEQALAQWEGAGLRETDDVAVRECTLLAAMHGEVENLTVSLGEKSVDARNRASAICASLDALEIPGSDSAGLTGAIEREFVGLSALVQGADADMNRIDAAVFEAKEAGVRLENAVYLSAMAFRPMPPLAEDRRQAGLARAENMTEVASKALERLWEIIYAAKDAAGALDAKNPDGASPQVAVLVGKIEEHLADASACPDVIANRLEELRRRDAALRARSTGEPAAVPTESPALDEAREKLELIMFLLELAETYRGRIQEAVNDAGVCRNQAAEFAASRNCNLLRARYQQALQQGGIEQAREIVRQAANCGWAAEAGREIETARCQRLGQALFDACQGNNVERVRALLGQFESSSCRINADLMTRARALASGNATPDAPAPEMLRGNLDPEARSSLLDKHLRSKKLQSISFDSSDVAVARGASGQWELTGPVQCVIRLDWGAGYVQGLASYSKIYTLNFRPVRGLEALLEIGTLTESVSVSGSRKQTRQTSKAKTVQGALSQQGDGWVLGLPNGIAGVIGDVPYRLR